jgi:hypothetical protein
MMYRTALAGLALAFALATVGCSSCCHSTRPCATPAVSGAIPITPSPAPCCNGTPGALPPPPAPVGAVPTPAYSVPVVPVPPPGARVYYR